MSGCSAPGACSSCGFPISAAGPAHDTGAVYADGRPRFVCDRCWHNPCLFFLPREIEIYGSYRDVLEHHWRLYYGIAPGQVTLFSTVPDFAELPFSAKGVEP